MVSNPSFLRGLRPATDLGDVEIRPAIPGEVADALHLILSTPSVRPDDRHVENLLRLARAYEATVPTMVALHSGRLISAVFPVVSSGRTMLLFPPIHLVSEFHEVVTRQLIDATCRHALAAGVHLAQVLMDTQESPLYSVLRECSFKPLAELLYMQTDIPGNLRPQPVPPDYYWLTYSPQTHRLFAQTILASYQESLDCPLLSGLRDIEDIIAGHKATGQFDPGLWFLLCRNESPIGVLLLSPIHRSDIVELVYLGVPPAHRHHGAADLLMRQAVTTVSASGYARLSLAVDANNLPAMRLYWRHGLQAIAKKTALLRDLRVPVVALGPAIQKTAPPSQPEPIPPAGSSAT